MAKKRTKRRPSAKAAKVSEPTTNPDQLKQALQSLRYVQVLSSKDADPSKIRRALGASMKGAVAYSKGRLFPRVKQDRVTIRVLNREDRPRIHVNTGYVVAPEDAPLIDELVTHLLQLAGG